LGIQRAKYLPLASTLCRACAEVCPVRIPLPDLLLTLRRRIVEQHGLPWLERKMMEIWGASQASPKRYQAALGLAKIGQEFMPGLLPSGVHLPEKNFHRIWKDGQD
jgi:L-lactate dehydrogenase complex protein LldF